jgi:hypothetical protein
LTRIELIATDGTTQRKILWIDAKQNGVYLGFCHQGRDTHTSYHRDGNVFSTINGKPDRMVQRQPLATFKNTQPLASFGFDSDIRTSVGVHYDLKQVDALVYLDMRPLQKKRGYVNCVVDLLEPERFDLLNDLAKLPGLKQIQIFTDYRPWIVVSILCIRRANISKNETHEDTARVYFRR